MLQELYNIHKRTDYSGWNFNRPSFKIVCEHYL